MNYKNGKVYAIRSLHTDKVYIGSTTQPLSKRLWKHKNNWSSWKAGKFHYVSSFEILEAGEAYIELVKNCPCDSKEELRREEGITIRATDCVNKQVAGRTYKEYYQDNKEQILENQRQHYQENKEQILEQHKQYYQENKEYFRKLNKQQYQDNKEQILEQRRRYRQENKEQILEKQRQHYEKNKERISKQRKKEKVGCVICKSMVRKSDFKKHERTKKHQAKKEDYEEKRFLKAFRKATIDDPEFNEYFKQFEYVQNE